MSLDIIDHLENLVKTKINMKRCISVERLNLFVQSLENDAQEIVKHVRPAWPLKEVKHRIFTDGITNRLIGCYLESDPDDMILIRVYGEKTELFIDRKAERRNMELMHNAGLAPPLFCTFENGICYGFTPGKVFDENMVRDPVLSKLVGDNMARMHLVKRQLGSEFSNGSPGNVASSRRFSHELSNSNGYVTKFNGDDSQPCLFRTIRRFLQLMPSALPDPKEDARLKASVPRKEALEAELAMLEEELTALDSPVVFCHNDLLIKNIVYTEAENKVTFIDFEYADYNYQAFDIGNHFAEFAGVDTYMPEMYPDREFQMEWLRNYLEAWHSLTHYGYLTHEDLSTEIQNLINDQVEVLYVQVNKFSLAANFLWGIWSLVQAANSSIEFDFLGYAIQRLDTYFDKKDQMLSLTVQPTESTTNHDS